MAKCDICGKSISFGIQVSHSTDVPTVHGNPMFVALRRSLRVLETDSRLHPLLAFGQSHPRCLKPPIGFAEKYCFYPRAAHAVSFCFGFTISYLIISNYRYIMI